MGREALCGKCHMSIIDRQFDSLTTHTKKKAQKTFMVEVHPAYTKKKRDFRFRFFFRVSVWLTVKKKKQQTPQSP